MPTSLKRKNRRFKRDNLLEVKLHSKQVRARRVRILSRCAAWTLGLLLAVAGIWHGLEWAVDQFVYRNPTFAIQEIDVRTDGIIPREQLQEWTGVRLGENLFAVDLQNVKRFLKLNSLVQDAAVDRVLPSTLRVRVIEREPIAQFTTWQRPSAEAALQPVMLYLDEEGYVLTPSDLPKLSARMAEHFKYLPKLAGVEGSEVRTSHPIVSARIRAALRLIDEFSQSSMAAMVDLTDVDVSISQILVATTRQGSQITFGYGIPDIHLHRWRLVHDYAVAASRSIATLDLSVSNNVPARWHEAAPPAQPKPLNLSRYKKKHV
jgi:cell division septal protein FtsQ